MKLGAVASPPSWFRWHSTKNGTLLCLEFLQIFDQALPILEPTVFLARNTKGTTSPPFTFLSLSAPAPGRGFRAMRDPKYQMSVIERECLVEPVVVGCGGDWPIRPIRAGQVWLPSKNRLWGNSLRAVVAFFDLPGLVGSVFLLPVEHRCNEPNFLELELS